MTVVTRFAPSPTGFLHIGGARTALFNWLYARGRGGKMLLRIEDTDRERSTQAAIDAILDGLTWLGVNWDDEAVYQFSRAARHSEIAERLLAEGHAYRCYTSQDELAQMREAARREGRAKLYDGRWRDRDPSEAPADAKATIRLKAPLTGETVIEDQVQGRVVWQNENLDDLVLLRSDGTPTYMLAVVVDDHDMAVTHIIRGDDHLTNAARQKQIYDALGWLVPVMAHIPLIHGPDGSKLSKRHGALGIDAYRALGYLPAALRNYLVRLGWSHGDQETSAKLLFPQVVLHVRQQIARRIHAAVDQRRPAAVARPMDRLLRHPPHRHHILPIDNHARKSAVARQQAHRLQMRSITLPLAAAVLDDIDNRQPPRSGQLQRLTRDREQRRILGTDGHHHVPLLGQLVRQRDAGAGVEGILRQRRNASSAAERQPHPSKPLSNSRDDAPAATSAAVRLDVAIASPSLRSAAAPTATASCPTTKSYRPAPSVDCEIRSSISRQRSTDAYRLRSMSPFDGEAPLLLVVPAQVAESIECRASSVLTA